MKTKGAVAQLEAHLTGSQEVTGSSPVGSRKYKERYYMKKFLFVIVLLSLLGCREKGGFSDDAYIVKAQSSMIKIRNALEQYRIDNGSYPAENNKWLEKLKPYFTREVAEEPDEIIRMRLLTMEAGNSITQVSGIYGELRRKALFADSSLAKSVFDVLVPVESVLMKIKNEVQTGNREDYKDPIPLILKVDSLMKNINVGAKKKEYIEIMISEKNKLKGEIDSLRSVFSPLIDSGKIDTLDFKKLNTAIDGYFSYTQSKKMEGKQLPSTDEAIDDIEKTFDKKKDKEAIDRFEQLRKEITDYKRVLLNIQFLDYVRVFNKKVPITVQLIKKYLTNMREDVIKANKILYAYEAMDRLRSLLSIYREEHKSLPIGNLGNYFGQLIEYKDIVKNLADHPVLDTLPDNKGYVMKAPALDKERTEVVYKINYRNNLNDIIQKSFAKGPFYSTVDSLHTFFVKARALDSFNSLVTIRPEFIGSKVKPAGKTKGGKK